MCLSCTGPSLLDLSIITDSSTDEIAYVFVARSVGGLIGGVISTIIVKYFNNWVRLCVLPMHAMCLMFCKNSFS